MSHFTFLYSRNGGGLLLRQLVALPDGEVFAGLAHEQDFAVIGVKRIRREQQDGFLLVHAREVKQVGVLQVAHRAVGVGGHDIIGVQHRERAGRQQLDQPFAVQGKQGG